MSMLTKISVVLLVVLVLLICPVVINLATVGPRYRDLLNESRSRCAILELEAAHAKLALDVATRERDAAIEAAAKSEAASRAVIDELKADKSTLETGSAAMLGRIRNLTTQLKVLEDIVKDVNARHDRLMAQAAKDRELINEKDVTIKRLTVEVEQTAAKGEKALKLAKVRAEEIAALNQTIKGLQEQLAGKQQAGGREGASEETPVLEATIDAYSQGIASINVGRNHGVKPGMELIVRRGGRFVGMMLVAQVEAEQSVGTIKDTPVDLTPRVGDKVTSNLMIKGGR